MKKIVLSFLALSLGIGVYAQNKRVSLPAQIRNQAVVKQAPIIDTALPNNIPLQGHPGTETVLTNNRNGLISVDEIGITYFDIQTNSSPGERIVNYGNGTLSAVWAMSYSGASGWPDRGTGYNHSDGNAWGAIPTTRIETIRTGYPGLAGNAIGECVVAHNYPTSIVTNRQIGFSQQWAEGTLSSQTGFGITLPHVVQSGNFVHMIAVTDVNGPTFNGVRNQLLYFRSPDGGTTWDMVDVQLPGTTSADWTGTSADSYSIYANGSNVVIASFHELSGVIIWKSTDNGSNFFKTIVAPFPIPLFDYTIVGNITDVNGDALVDTIYTSDGSGDVILDSQGKVHVVWGQTQVVDNGLDNGYSYFPGVDGVLYWNETRAANDFDTIGFLQDRNGDGYFSIFTNTLPSTQVGATSHSNIGIDLSGRLYVAYSGLVDSTRDLDNQPYRHVFVTGSADGGETWNPNPVDIVTDSNFGPGASEFLEATFPVLATKVDDKMHLIYQADGDAGVGLQQVPSVSQLSSIYYSAVDADIAIPTLGTIKFNSYSDINRSSFKMTPNPAIDYSTVDFALTLDSEVSINVMDVNGAVIRTQNLGKLNAGSNQTQLNVSDLAAGIYMVRINTANGSITGKMVVVKK